MLNSRSYKGIKVYKSETAKIDGLNLPYIPAGRETVGTDRGNRGKAMLRIPKCRLTIKFYFMRAVNLAL